MSERGEHVRSDDSKHGWMLVSGKDRRNVSSSSQGGGESAFRRIASICDWERRHIGEKAARRCIEEKTAP